MTVDLLEINPSATCTTDDNTSKGRYISIEMEATMPEETDPDFSSPFRSDNWGASTEEGDIAATAIDAGCEGGATILNLMDEFPEIASQQPLIFQLRAM